MSKRKQTEVPEMGDTTIVLNLVEIKKGVQSNKYYNMVPRSDGQGFRAEYGRIGSTKTTHEYSSKDWSRVYKSRIRKGYKDCTELRKAARVALTTSSNPSFESFANFFGDSTVASVKTAYNIKNCTDAQLSEASKILKNISTKKTVKSVNKYLLELFSVIPRKMNNVNEFLIEDISQKLSVISREQDALDSMNSSNILQRGTDILGEMNMQWEELQDLDYLMTVLNDNAETRISRSRIKAGYKISKIAEIERFQTTRKNVSHSDKTEHLIHGTRSANIFSIFKTGLKIRPSNAHWSGSNYGDGIYHSADAYKSLGYTGSSYDSLLLIQNVNMGNPCYYNGWQRDGKGIARKDMNESYLRQEGFDSMYVKKGDGLRASEMIVYNEGQTITEFLLWCK